MINTFDSLLLSERLLEVFLVLISPAIASFSMALISRLEKELPVKEMLSKRSSCESCGKVLSAFELIPLLSYIFLGGRCKRCGIAIGKEVFIAELFFLIAALILFWFQAPVWQYLVMFTLLFLSFYDYKAQYVPKFAVHFLILLSFFISVMQFWSLSTQNEEVLIKIVGLILALLIVLMFFVANRFKSYMGTGDILLIISFGLITRGLDILVILFVASISGLLLMIPLFIKQGRVNTQLRVSFIPFLTIGYLVTVVISSYINDWFTTYLLIW